MSIFKNRYGSFDASGGAYTITDRNTPRPWCNVVSNGRFGFVVSQNGGGFSWFDDAQHNVLTRWEMDLVRDCSGKFLYLADRDTGKVWSVAPAPCNTEHDSYACTHEPGVTAFRTSAHGIASEWTMFVAPDGGDGGNRRGVDAGVEIWTLTLTNTGREARRLRVSSYFEWSCGVAPDSKREFHKLFFTTKHDAKRHAVLATKNMWDIPGGGEKEHWNRPWPYAAAHAVCGVEFERDIALADKEMFLGRYGSTANPALLAHGKSAKGARPAKQPLVGGFGRFGDACAAVGGDLTIRPGASVSMHFVIAIARDEKSVLRLVDRYAKPAMHAKALSGARETWRTIFAKARVTSKSPAFDLMHNTWLPYQAISARLWGRTGYYQQSGARGFRDQLQDSQVWLGIDPPRCAEQIMLHAGRQFADGSVNHWWHELADFGNHTECSDDYLWLAYVTASYLKETGDFALLARRAGYQDKAKADTLLEHCTRSLERAFRRLSARGLPLIGSCDWNDGLSALGVGGKGESVWLGMFLCQILEDWRVVYARVGDAERSSRCTVRRAAMVKAINTHAWDGSAYKCATKDSGEWIGARSAPEGKIHLNPQTWAILAGVAPPARAKAAWASVRKKLLTPYGPLLLAPAYRVPDPDIGYITRYSPGSRENGGVYMHAATWALAAACKARDVVSVEKIWKSIAPPLRSADAEAYCAEPYVLPGNVDGPQGATPGRAGWTWYTGSAAWLRRVCTEWVLGVRPVWDAASGGEALLVEPVLPAMLGDIVFERSWRKWRLAISMRASEIRHDSRTRLALGHEDIGGSMLTTRMLEKAAPGGGLVEVRVRGESVGTARARAPQS